MSEFGTLALILDKEPLREHDLEIHLFTEKLGRVTARAIGARKILSKLSAHLEPNSISFLRLVEKHGFLAVDALLEKKMNFSLPELLILKHGATEFERDDFLWEKIMTEKLDMREVLAYFGFGEKFSSCFSCGENNPDFFCLKLHEYICGRCVFNLGMEGEEKIRVRE